MVIFTPGNELDGAALVHARREVRRQLAERHQQLVHAGRAPHRRVVGLGELDARRRDGRRGRASPGSASILPILPRSFSSGGDLGAAGDPRVDHDHLAARRGDLEGGLADTTAARSCPAAPRRCRASARHAADKQAQHDDRIMSFLSLLVGANPSRVPPRRKMSLFREPHSPTMRAQHARGRSAADEHQGQGLHRRHLRASDAAGEGHLAGADPRRSAPRARSRMRASPRTTSTAISAPATRPASGRCRWSSTWG